SLSNGQEISFEATEGSVEKYNPITLLFRKDNNCEEKENSIFNIFAYENELKIFNKSNVSNNLIVNVTNIIGEVIISNIAMGNSYANKVIDVSGLSGIYL